MANVLTSALDDIVADAATASASLATITAGSDAVVSNFAGLKDLVDELSAFATVLRDSTFYAPVGGIIPFGGSSAPAGWFLCDGSLKSKSTYADLFAVLGANAYGTDTGSDFYLPDLRGRVAVGLGSHVDVDSRADSDGVTLANRRPKHGHTVSTDGSHTHSIAVTYTQSGHTHQFSSYVSEGPYEGAVVGSSKDTGSAGSHTHTVGVSSAPVDGPAYAVVNYIIKF